MKKRLSVVLLACLLVAAGGMAGCESMGKGSNSTSAGMPTYVMVTPGNGAPYTVVVPAGHPEATHVVAKAGVATCSQCIADAKAYALTGKMDPVCKSCGAKRESMVATTPTIGYQ